MEGCSVRSPAPPTTLQRGLGEGECHRKKGPSLCSPADHIILSPTPWAVLHDSGNADKRYNISPTAAMTLNADPTSSAAQNTAIGKTKESALPFEYRPHVLRPHGALLRYSSGYATRPPLLSPHRYSFHLCCMKACSTAVLQAAALCTVP